MTGSGLGLSMARSNSRIRCMTIAMALATAPCPAWAQTIHTFIDFADQRPRDCHARPKAGGAPVLVKGYIDNELRFWGYSTWDGAGQPIMLFNMGVLSRLPPIMAQLHLLSRVRAPHLAHDRRGAGQLRRPQADARQAGAVTSRRSDRQAGALPPHRARLALSRHRPGAVGRHDCVRGRSGRRRAPAGSYDRTMTLTKKPSVSVRRGVISRPSSDISTARRNR